MTHKITSQMMMTLSQPPRPSPWDDLTDTRNVFHGFAGCNIQRDCGCLANVKRKHEKAADGVLDASRVIHE